ncbi:hypothetical protein [Candidatus Solirubrobacter pratensis]|uniref:hypothetical protein n=1 Tax=Candidatus Solirubrobacter pratensis TaxID=1298857 RepID=UPI000421F772|nr:hypothetical protein [Candidatus Solirubrobacter pratensis]
MTKDDLRILLFLAAMFANLGAAAVLFIQGHEVRGDLAIIVAMLFVVIYDLDRLHRRLDRRLRRK